MVAAESVEQDARRPPSEPAVVLRHGRDAGSEDTVSPETHSMSEAVAIMTGAAA